MKAVIYNGGYVVGCHDTPNPTEFDALGTQYDLIDEVPGVIRNTPPGHIVKRLNSGEYVLEALPPEPSDLDILGQQLVALELRLLAVEGGGGVE